MNFSGTKIRSFLCPRSTWIWVGVILLFSLLLKLLCKHLDPVVSRDGCLYIRLAQIWYDSGSFKDVIDACPMTWLPPLLLYLMKCLMKLNLSAETAGFLLNLILGTFTPLLTYGIAYEVTQKKDIAICSALLIAVNPSMNELSIEVQRDMVYLFFIGVVLWLLAAGIRRQKWYCWLGMGFFCGCAMLTRYETIEILIIVPVVLVFLCIAKYSTLKKCLCHGFAFSAAFICTLFFLITLMQTEEFIFLRYKEYFQGKVHVVEQQYNYDPEPKETAK